MKISAKSDYAVRAILEIARGPHVGPRTAEEIAAVQNIPRNFLLVILADLRRAGLVRSRRGQAGGWAMGRDAGDVTLADIIRAVDGPLASIQGERPEAVSYEGETAILQHVWIALRSSIRDVLETVTVGELVAQTLPEPVKAHAARDDAWHPH